MGSPILPLVFFAAVVDRAAYSAEATFDHLHRKMAFLQQIEISKLLAFISQATFTAHPGNPQVGVGSGTLAVSPAFAA